MARIWARIPFQQHEVFQSKMYASCFQPLSYSVIFPSAALMMPTFTGRSTKGGSHTSGWNARWGTLRKRLLSTIQAECSGACSARSTSSSSLSVLSNPLGSTWGGLGSAHRTSARPRPPTIAKSPTVTATRNAVRIIATTSSRLFDPVQHQGDVSASTARDLLGRIVPPQFGGNSLGQNFPPTSLILSLPSWLFGYAACI